MGVKVLKMRNLESYMFDDEVIKKLCESVGQPEKYEECLSEKAKALNDSKNRGNASDDYKSASGDIYVALKKRLSLTQCGNSPDFIYS